MCVIYQNISFLRNCLHVANVTEFIAAESRTGQEKFANLLFSRGVLGETLLLKKALTVLRRSEMQSEHKEKQENAKGKLKSDIQRIFC